MKPRILLAALFLISTSAYIVVTPVGEGPDEMAHLVYVRLLQQKLQIPPIERLGDSPHAYELHHPPTYYASAALWARLAGASLDYPVITNPGFPHSKKGGAFLPAPPTSTTLAAHRGVLWVRTLGLLTGLTTLLALFAVANKELPNSTYALLVATPFALAPQLAFISSLVSNDGLTIALSSLVLLLGRQLLDESRKPQIILIGILASLAIWTKASGVFLMAPLAVVALAQSQRGRKWHSAAVLLPASVALAAFMLAWQPRFEVFRAAFSSVVGLKDHPELLAKYPFWWIQLWGSFFAKFTQFQLRLPWPLYFLFMPVSLLVAYGLVLAWRRRREPTSPEVYWGLALLTNLGLLVIFMIFVDFQHQGRLMWPSAAAAVGCAAIAARRLITRFRVDLAERWVVISVLVFFIVDLVGVAVILKDEGVPPSGLFGY